MSAGVVAAVVAVMAPIWLPLMIWDRIYPDPFTRAWRRMRSQRLPPERFADELAKAVEMTGLETWNGNEATLSRGLHYIVGVAFWNGFDLPLLIELNRALRKFQPDCTVHVYSTDDRHLAQQAMPALARIYDSPTVGVWQDGRPVAAGCGWRAERLLSKPFPGLTEGTVRQCRTPRWRRAASAGQLARASS